MNKRKLILPLLLIFSSCTKDLVSECEDMASKVSQGNTTHQNRWESKCKNVDTKLTLEFCKKAFVDLVKIGHEEALIKKYGPKVMRCFNKKDKKLFLIKKGDKK